MIGLKVHYRPADEVRCGQRDARNFTTKPDEVTCWRCRKLLVGKMS